MGDADLRVHLVDARGDQAVPADGLDRCRRTLRAVAARLGIDLGAGTPPLPTWVVMLERPSRIQAYAASFGLVALAGQIHEGLTWPGGSMVPSLDDAALLCHEGGHWLGHHRLGVSCVDPATWRASERLARRAEGPGWIARLFGARDPWAGVG